MKLVKELGLKDHTSKTGNVRRRPYGIFQCPKCLCEVEKLIQNGEKSLSCGTATCKESHPELSGAAKRDPIYTAWIYMKQLCREDGESYPAEWKDFNVFFDEIGKNRSVGGRLTRFDPTKPYSVNNCFWKTPQVKVKGMAYTAQRTAKGRQFEQHGMHATRPYRVWQNMKNRCYFDKHKSYKNYGAKGITVCDEWKDSFASFWVDMEEGYNDTLTIDRIDPLKGYFKANCRWLSLAENSGRSRAKTTKQLDKATGELIKEWPSARVAGLELNIDPSSITKVCNGKKKSAGGYCWKN